MKKITLLASALSVFVIAACRSTSDDQPGGYAERQAGTGGTAQRDFDDRMDSRGEYGTMPANYSSGARTADSDRNTPGGLAERPAGSLGTAQRDFEDEHDSYGKHGSRDTHTTYGTGGGAGTSGSASKTSQAYGGSTGPSSTRTTTHGSSGMAGTQTSPGARAPVVAGTAGTAQRDYDDRADSRDAQGRDRIGLTEASARRDQVDAGTMISSWGSVAQEAARTMISKYGQPDDVTEEALIWRDNGPWKKTVVHKMEVDHNFPAPHKDVLEQKVEMRVPADKIDDIAQFDGSITVDRTKGVVSATCDKEEMNFVALNLANEIATGKRNVEQARAMIAQAAMQVKSGQVPDIGQRLTFTPARGNAADPDARHTGDALNPGSGVQSSEPRGGMTDPDARSSTTKKPVPDDTDDTIDRDQPNRPINKEKPDNKPGEEPDSKDDVDEPPGL